MVSQKDDRNKSLQSHTSKYVATTNTSICDSRRLLKLQIFECSDLILSQAQTRNMHTSH